jgi:tRNA dimethylallyltransferase
LSAEPLLVVIVGPTASGKTSLSLELAMRFHGEVVNCDSVAIFREFSIGTAKPTPAERARAVHHLFDVVDPTAFTTAGEYARMARNVIREISARRALPIVVGGSGLYLRALLEGLFPGPQRSPELRVRLHGRAQERGPHYLYRMLERLDPTTAERIHVNDVPKLIRAIEVCVRTRRPMSEQWSIGRDTLEGFRILRIGLNPPRAQLYERINRRVEKMFAGGMIEETKSLLARYGEAAYPLVAIGYKQVLGFLRGEFDQPGVVAAVQQAHRNYAKRQMTWFRREPEAIWIEGFGDASEVQDKAAGLVERSLR